MEIREFAEKILFATTLEEKLSPPDRLLRDDQPGPPIAAPGIPGRPASLIPKRGQSNAHLPANAHLVNEDSRARLLHFFANHELLAVELMALVLLKFPDAPKAFRRGVLHTLKEEQCHTRWYVQRMRECGLEFGDIPVSSMIWDHIAPMDSPLDYVSRLSLTFEQANLDYSKHYGEVMSQAGDHITAAILNKIYKDEIAHVGYGLAWFRRWKDARQSDWDAFRQKLVFPLSPARAKGGVAFNRQGRLNAGLDPHFITQLELFTRSRSRTPNVFCCHPTAEAEFAAAKANIQFHPTKAQSNLTLDLESLMAWAASTDDLMLLRKAPRQDHLLYLRRHGLLFPDWDLLPQPTPSTSITERRLGQFRPWAWSPTAIADLAPLQYLCSMDSIVTDPSLFEKSTIRTLLEPALANSPFPLPPAHIIQSTDELPIALKSFAAKGCAQVVLKANLASAAQGNLRIPTNNPDAIPPLQWLTRTLRSGPVLLEPWFDKLFEFSIHYERTDDESLRMIGFSRLHTDQRGQWTASSAGPKFCRGLPLPIARFFMNAVRPFYQNDFPDILQKTLQGIPHCGPLGIDAFIYRSNEGSPALHCMVECNPRFTMGRIALSLRRHIASNTFLTLTTIPYNSTTGNTLPLPILDADGKFQSGSLYLGDPQTAITRIPILHVSKTNWPATTKPPIKPQPPRHQSTADKDSRSAGQSNAN